MTEIDYRLLVGLESALSSHIRNMIITVGAGLTIFNIQNSNNKIDSNIVPWLFIVVGVAMGCYALYTYKRNIVDVKSNTFTYDSKIWRYYTALCTLQILVVIGFGYFTFTKIIK